MKTTPRLFFADVIRVIFMIDSLNISIQTLFDIIQPLDQKGATRDTIHSIASLDQARPGDLSFLGNKKYAAQVGPCKASVIIVARDYSGSEPIEGQTYWYVENPSAALGKVCELIEQKLFPKIAPGIHPSAVIDPSAQIGENVTIGAHCVIESGVVVGPGSVLRAQVFVGRCVKMGKECTLMPHVSLMDYSELGERVIIHSGAVIGSDGFGYETINGVHHKQAQVGYVKIGDDVEIGANTTIDRARFSVTEIGVGTKIDNLVQIAHNVKVGPHCILVSQVGISGSTTLGHHVVLAGQVGLAGHIHIGDMSQVGGQSGLNSDLAPGSVVRGSPAHPLQFAHRLEVLKKKLPELFARVKRLESLTGVDSRQEESS